MKNFIDFITDATKNSVLGDELHDVVHGGDHKVVSSWLKERGYNVSEEDSKKLVDNRNDVKSSKLGISY